MKLQIEKAIYGGAGLGRVDGKAVFVPFTLPGEIVEAHITEDKRSFANADLDAVLERSSERTNPQCEYFGLCGGCQYQHATYAQQTEMKVSILQETLTRARLTSLPEIIPIHAEPLGYRNRIRLHIQREPFALCYKRRASHTNLPVNRCPIAAPLLERALQVTTRIGKEYIQEFDEIEFFTNESESELLLSLWTRQQTNKLPLTFSRFCEALKQELSALVGAAVFPVKPAEGQEKKLAQWGSQSLTYHVAGNAYRVSIGSFFQVNRFLIDRLVRLVTAEPSGKLAWDLYAGVGLFARVLSQKLEKIVAVEAAPSSWADLGNNLLNGTHQTIRSGTLDFLRKQHEAAPDLIVVDPPRTGLGGSVVSMLTKVRPQSIVYVSCDPATLSRDLHALVESGYHLRTVHMVDLFPQTFHLESVTVLSSG
jgi:23S rRNA (uracil1939-C5)-methyltransferase